MVEEIVLQIQPQQQVLPSNSILSHECINVFWVDGLLEKDVEFHVGDAHLRVFGLDDGGDVVEDIDLLVGENFEIDLVDDGPQHLDGMFVVFGFEGIEGNIDLKLGTE